MDVSGDVEQDLGSGKMNDEATLCQVGIQVCLTCVTET